MCHLFHWKGSTVVPNGWSNVKYSASNENHTVSARPINFQHTQLYWIYWKSTLNIEVLAKKIVKYLGEGNYVRFIVRRPFSPDVRNWSPLPSHTVNINFEPRALLNSSSTQSYFKIKIEFYQILFQNKNLPEGDPTPCLFVHPIQNAHLYILMTNNYENHSL